MLSKKLFRKIFVQGRGQNFRKLSKEEKLIAEKNFYDSFSKSKQKMPKIRNPIQYFKSLSFGIEPPIAQILPTEIKTNNEILIDNYAWMQEESNYSKWEDYLHEESVYTENVTAKSFYLTRDLLREFSERKPQTTYQVVEKGG